MGPWAQQSRAVVASLASLALAACGSRSALSLGELAEADPPAEAASSTGGGCTPSAGCSCCGDLCVDVSTDVEHCGACDSPCGPIPHAEVACVDGGCVMGPCHPPFSDCNGLVEDGCETRGPCGCVPGQVLSCYEGPQGTERVGLCRAGDSTCDAGGRWGPCLGQVLPQPEVCNSDDDDCDGFQPELDADGDGWSPCDADCCDDAACASVPQHVNPGALELPGNGMDDDCDPSTPDDAPSPVCAGTPLDVPTSPDELVMAMDLCQFTTESPPLPERKWGVITSALVLSDGKGAPGDVQVGVLAGYGPNVPPEKSSTMAALSSGTARAEGDPGFVHPQNGPEDDQIGNFDAQTVADMPESWLAAHGGELPPTPCPECAGASCLRAFDPVDLRVRIRVPTNVGALSFQHRFYTAEFPEFVCAEHEDRFLALLTSTAPGVPADGNIALDAAGGLVSVDAGLFEICFPPSGAPVGACPGGALELVGTGMGGWLGNVKDGGATTWLRAESPVVPGETIELHLVIWDGGDHNVDSLVLLDDFEWEPLGGP